ncbi:MAG TPA: hypothetical protein VKS60_12235 [Stellaceae bacterium]|nr:hypothetical protein [Stellaceae bacterium]
MAPITVDPKPAAARISGRYAVFIGAAPNGLSSKLNAACTIDTVEAGLLEVYRPALQSALVGNFEHVDFLPARPTKQALAEKGYKAGFVFSVMSMEGVAVTAPKFGSQLTPDIFLGGTMVMLDAAGEHAPVLVTGHGQNLTSGRHGCDGAAADVGEAAHYAYTDLIQHELDAARDAVRHPAAISQTAPP